MSDRQRADQLERWLIGVGLVVFLGLWAGIPFVLSGGYESGWLNLVGLVVGGVAAGVVVGGLRGAIHDAFGSDPERARYRPEPTAGSKSKPPAPSRRAIRNWIFAGAPDQEEFWATSGVDWDYDEDTPGVDHQGDHLDQVARQAVQDDQRDAAAAEHHERLAHARRLQEEGLYSFSQLLEIEEFSRVEMEWTLSPMSHQPSTLDELRKIFTRRQRGDMTEAEWIILKHRILYPHESAGATPNISSDPPRGVRRSDAEGRY